jgi:2'-5' RNA ligase
MTRFESALVAAAAQHSGAMIALAPSDDDAQRLAVPGYEPASALHTTLVFLGSAAAWTGDMRDQLEMNLREIDTLNMPGEIWGTAKFNPRGPQPCSVYLIKCDGITHLRAATLGAIARTPGAAAITPIQHECYVPHITVGYGLGIKPLTKLSDPIRFDRLRLSFADNDVRDIPLGPKPFPIPHPDSVATYGGADLDGRVLPKYPAE